MESKYNIDNFERFLREKSDEFRMYPSKRVWYSIYNNMHPGNRLPSISMSIVLIFALLLVGYLNTNSSNQFNSNEDTTNVLQVKFAKSSTDNFSPFSTYGGANDQNHSNGEIIFVSSRSAIENVFTTQFTGKQIGNTITNSNAFYNGTQQSNPVNDRNKYQNKEIGISKTGTTHAALTTGEGVASVISSITKANLNKSNIEAGTETEINRAENQSSTLNPDAAAVLTNLETTVNTQSTGNKNIASILQKSASKNESIDNFDLTALGAISTTKEATADAIASTDKNNAENKTNNKLTSLSETDKAWIENFALYNKPAPKKWAGKIGWQAYFTPSVVYRVLHNNAAGKFPGSNTSVNFNNTDVNDIVNQKPSFGMETGIALQYDLLRRVKVKIGVQFNYTRYNTHAFENYHPLATSLGMNSNNGESVYEVFRTTPFTNGTGLTPIKLHNETYQISLPVGADFKLASFDNLEWYAGATVQPTIVVYGRSHLISTDRRNYVQDPSMLNRFNLNAGVETYISFKTDNYTWQVGPQFRSQIFSTNSKLYSIEERLQNFGFKIGISKKL